MDFFAEHQIEIGDDTTNKYTMVTVPKYQRNSTSPKSVQSIFKMNAFGIMVVLSIVLISISPCQSAALPDNKPVSAIFTQKLYFPVVVNVSQNILYKMNDSFHSFTLEITV